MLLELVKYSTDWGILGQWEINMSLTSGHRVRLGLKLAGHCAPLTETWLSSYASSGIFASGFLTRSRNAEHR